MGDTKTHTRIGATAVLAGLVALSLALTAPAARADETVNVCGPNPNDVFQHAATFGINTVGTCPNPPLTQGGMGITTAGNRVAAGQRADWQANAPAGLAIIGASVPGSMVSTGINDGSQYGGGFYWARGGAQTTDGETSASFSGFSSSYFGFQIVCGANPCTSGTSQIDVDQIALTVRETQGPGLVAPDGLWQQSGWVRGSWPVHFYGNSPSGLCSLSATLNGQALTGSTGSGVNSATWRQCSAPAYNTTVNTADYGQGAVPLVLNASDAAGVPASASKTVYIDNSIPTLTLSGPVDAPTTAGTQYVTASAGGSPSGIAEISCSVDGASPQTFSSATAQVPVSGIGQHTVSCTAFDNAIGSAGNHGASQPETWSIKIGEPTILGVAFQKLAGLRCHRTRVRKKVPGHWITVRRHGKRVRIKTRPHTKLVKVTRCHPRTVRKRTVVYVPVRRHGKTVKVKRIKYVRVVVPPHIVSNTKKYVRYGHRTSVSGFLGTADGTALPGHVVRVLTAPNNGLGQFTQVAAVTTAANGTWTAELPRGPSRIVEAVFDGDPVTESTASGQVQVTVSAKIKLLSVSPKRVPWGHTVRITGRLLGGYLPAGGVNLRLRIGIGRNRATYGVQEHVAGNGRFSTTYTFGAGYPGIHRRYWFEIATLPSGNYPYAPSASNRQYVLVGGHPRSSCRRSSKLCM
jgi:hypothetical protein